MNVRTRISNVAWMIFLCIMTFMLIAALWIRRTYGTLSFAMTDESFRNGLQNKRTLFVRGVLLPTFAVFMALLIIQITWRKLNRRLVTVVSALLMIVSLGVSVVILDATSYLKRLYRLNQEQWYDIDNAVVHALGNVDGVTYTNSKEALENSYRDGRRLFECDLVMTSDGKIVACHDWELWNRETNPDDSAGEDYAPTLETFMSHKIMGKYTPMSGSDIVLFLKEHPDAYIITDTKYAEPEKIKEEFDSLVDIAIENDCEKLLDHFVVQIYHEYMYDVVNNIYPFPNYIFTLYAEGYRGEENKMQQYASFCMIHNIDVITMNAEYYQSGLTDICDRYGLHMFVHTVNEDDEIKAFHEKGIGVYTDNSL